jgi:hypothetical protein
LRQNGAADAPIRTKPWTYGDFFKLSVADLGEPFSSAAMEHLCQPFYRYSLRPTQQRLGFELHIASMIAQARGGRLDAHPAGRRCKKLRKRLRGDPLVLPCMVSIRDKLPSRLLMSTRASSPERRKIRKSNLKKPRRDLGSITICDCAIISIQLGVVKIYDRPSQFEEREMATKAESHQFKLFIGTMSAAALAIWCACLALSFYGI